jgi:holliday junction DNA helicase RuvB
MKNLSSPQEEKLDSTLRPKSWDEYIGQDKVKENIKVIVGASQKRKEICCEHLLLCGGSGLGKTTLAHLIAQEINSKIRITSGPAIERPGDLAALLTSLSPGEVFFIDEIHRLSKVCEEIIYPALENSNLDIILGKGPMARSLQLKLPPFTLIGATTMPSSLSAPLRNRFGAVFRLDFYKAQEIEKILTRSAFLLEINITSEALKEISKRSRLTPRVANRILKRVRDFAQFKNREKIDKDFVEQALDFLGIDNLGLESSDRKILETLLKQFQGGPVGIQALSSTLGEEEKTILEMYEPYLIQAGLIQRTPRGRLITEKALKHIKK